MSISYVGSALPAKETLNHKQLKASEVTIRRTVTVK